MKNKALRALCVLLSIAAVATGGSRNEGLNLVVQQIRIIGARQWLGLVAGSIVAGAPVIAPLSDRIALSVAYGPGPVAKRGLDNTA